MTAFYVNSGASGLNNGTSWTDAYTTLGSAVTAATGDGDIIYVHQTHNEELAADTSYTLANNIRIICSNDTSNTPPQTLGSQGTSYWIGNSTTNRSVTFTGKYKLFCYGLTLRIAGSTTDHINIGIEGHHYEFENCYFWQGNTGTNSRINLGDADTNDPVYLLFKNCTFRFAATAQAFLLYSYAVFIGCSISSSGSAVTTLFKKDTSKMIRAEFINCDLSHITGTLIDNFDISEVVFIFSNCKLGSGVTVIAAQTTTGKQSVNAFLYNCSSGDQHYHIGHYDALGSTICDTGIRASDGASYDGTNRLSWKIVTTANCSYYTPYVSPWIDCYHSGTSAITPYLEILRDGSNTDYQDDEVWGEFSYQGTSGYPLGTIVNDRKLLLASATDQTDGMGKTSWYKDASNLYGSGDSAWSGKLETNNPTSSITPAEIGHLRARVCVGEPSITVYVDPQIRGRS